jgi:Flp pilus assembly protein TadG
MSVPQATRVNFCRDTSGSVAVIFALLSTALFGFIALAIDMARANNVSSKLNAALDAAALAGAKALDGGKSDAEIREVAEAFFNSQMATLHVGDVAMRDFTATIDRSNATVIANVTVNMGTVVGRLIGKDTMNLDRSSTVTYKTRNVELAMALDITGSMDVGGRLASLQMAAKDVIDTMYAEASSEDGVRISIVPWSASVNAGTYAATVSNGASTDGCVVERQGPGAATDNYPAGVDASQAVSSDPRNWYNCTANPIMPLMGRSKKDDLKATIDSFVPNGGTAGHIGAAWGWYTVSPSWTSIWPSGSKPNPYSPVDTIKAVLLMSDGEMNLSWVNGTNTAPLTMIDEAYSQLANLCTEMKLKKVVVFTVGFGMTDPRAQVELRACSSGPQQFFQASSGSDLQQAFKAIATQLKSLRISK